MAVYMADMGNIWGWVGMLGLVGIPIGGLGRRGSILAFLIITQAGYRVGGKEGAWGL